MINRLVYEVRLRKLEKSARSKIHKKWRYDVKPYLTTDPEYPGVETGRRELGGGEWGYVRFRWQALKIIGNYMEENPHRYIYDEV